MNAAEREALKVALQLGLPSFACKEDKRPATPHGYKDAALPEAGLATQWIRTPGVLVGVPTGAIVGFDVLDIDSRNGGCAWYAENKAKIPPTRLHRTRSGGLHIFFKHLDGLRNSAGKIAPGVDVRSDGGFVIWWPATGLDVREHPLDSLPEWPASLMIKLLPEPSKSISAQALSNIKISDSTLEAKLRGVVNRVERATEGERNNVLFWAACRCAEVVRSGRVGTDWCAGLLEIVAVKAGLPKSEARRTIASGLRRD